MHRFRSWTLDPPEWRTQRNRLLPAEGGDGSTLNLDFMQGILDPSINFSRGSSAFIVNSSGLLQWAEHNYYYNTEFSGITTGTPLANGSYNGWQKILTPEGTLVVNTDQSITITVTNTQRCGVARTASIPYITWEMVVAVDIVNDPNATWSVFTIEDIFNEGSRTDVAFYVNGSQVAPNTLITGPCTIAWVFTKATNATITPYFGLSARTAGKAGTLRFKNPRFMYRNPLDTTFKYWVNTSTTADYQTPRFDYDPTPSKLGTLKGLLIEPQVTNLVTFSEVCVGSGWSSSSSAVTDTVTTVANPEGKLSTSRNYAVAGGTFHSTGINYTPTVNNQVVTASCWFKANNYTKAYIADGANGQYIALFDLVTGVATVGSPSGTATSNKVSCKMEPYSNGWWRCQVTATLPSTTVSVNTNYGGYPDTGTTITAYSVNYSGTGNVNDGIYVYGYQLEVSPCATSFIKTAVSVGGATRSPDVSRITDISSWFISDRELTVLADFIPYPRPASEFPSPVCFKDSGGAFHGYESYLQFPASTNGNTLTIATKISASTNTESNATTLQRNFERYRLGFAISSTSHLRSVNGVTCTTITPPNALPATGLIDVCGIGQSGLNSSYFAGWLRQIKYWPSFKAQADLNTITSLDPVTPTLEFDFRSGILPSNFSIIRSSNSTFTNNAGLVKFAPSNLVRYSTDFTQSAYWFQNASPTITDVTSTVPPPISGFAGKVIRLTTSNNNAYIDNSNIAVTAGFTYNASVYVKKAGSLNKFQFLLGTSGLWSAGNPFVVFDFSNPSASTTSGSISSWNYTDVGNGWYRINLTARCTASGNSSVRLYAHNGTDFADVYLWGAQMEAGFEPTPLTFTTTSAYYAPRFEHTSTGAVRGLLLEGQAINLARYSETLERTGAFWDYNNCNRFVDSAAIAPNGIAGVTYGVTSGTVSPAVYYSFSGASTTVPYTYSVWVRGRSVTSAIFAIFTPTVQAVTARVISGPGTFDASTTFPRITGLSTTAWTRISITTTANLAAASGIVYNYINSTTGSIGDSIELWGAQFEEGNGYSSYIPTGASQVTRIGDGYELSNIASANYSTTSGTLLNTMTINKQPAVSTYSTISGFLMAGDFPVFETFGNGGNLFVAIRGDNLQAGGLNETPRPYTLYTLTRQASIFNTDNDPIVSTNVNNSFNSVNRGATSSGKSKVPTRFVLNRASFLATTNAHPSAIIETIKYWPVSLSNIELTTLATG